MLVTALYRTDQPSGVQQRLTAALPQTGSRSTVVAAELLTLDPAPLALEAAP